MRRVLTSGIFVVVCFLTVVILAQVPQLLNYQGRLTDDKGIPIITTTTVRFSLYQGGDAATPGSGTLCYQEDASVTPDDNGVFNHLIGSGTVIYGALDSTVFQTAEPVFLEIAIDPAGANETLLPRKQIVTVGYSFKSELADDADTLDGQDASAFSPVIHNHDPDYVNEGQDDSVTSSMIVDGTIVDADINASANIAGSKINTTGLDADLLDGKDSEDFVHTTGDDMTGTLNVTSPAGYGVYGVAPTYGLYGTASATEGINYGVYGKTDSPEGTGVYGIAPTHGVYAVATATSGETYGVYGRSDSHVTGSSGVYGYSSGTYGYGVYGKANAFGVYGEATGIIDTTIGVFGISRSTSGRGVFGWATANSGENYGVLGRTWSASGYGVRGENPYGGYGGYFVGHVHVSGNFTVGGAKTCVQPIDNGKKVLLYAMESPEIWFEDFGTAQLVNGQAVVQLESVFLQTANTGIDYLVFLTPRGACQGLYISQQDKDAFEVRELGGGTSNISFNYRIVAKRRGYEEVRFEEFTEPEQSPEQANLPIERK